jgi:hypothetical protein
MAQPLILSDFRQTSRFQPARFSPVPLAETARQHG